MRGLTVQKKLKMEGDVCIVLLCCFLSLQIKTLSDPTLAILSVVLYIASILQCDM